MHSPSYNDSTYDLYPKIRFIYILNFYFLNEYKQIGNARNVIIDEIIYIGAYPVLGDTNNPSNAGPKPIVASQNMKNVESA